MKITLDPGHGPTTNPGVISGYVEGSAMYLYSQRLAQKLRALGYEVLITRKTIEDNPSLWNRGKMAKGSDMFVSLHSNAGSSTAAHGISIFYSIKRPEDKDMATKWGVKLAECMGTYLRGSKTRQGGGDWDYYTVIQSAIAQNVPHVLLVEHGFHSNPAECAWLMQDANLDKMAATEAALIDAWLNPSGNINIEIKETDAMDYRKVNVVDDVLNVRNTSSVTGQIVTTYPPGKIVVVLEQAANGWCRTADGWVNGSYLEKVDTVPVTLPVSVAAGLKDALGKVGL